ncbi:MAG: molybdopterin binding domain protein [Clostridia bacterium]|nr:molybdopterin binding domain protein [Clostridia bacterium]
MELISVNSSEGMVLCHDITEIIPDKYKGAAFKKGHVIQKEDIPKLLRLGKEHLYVWNLEKGYLHENDAALRIATAVAGEGIILSEPKEGKIDLIAARDGLLKINIDSLYKVNENEQIVLSTIHGNVVVKKGKVLAGTRIIPLVIQEEQIEALEKLARENYSIINIKPLKSFNVGIVTTGNEVYKGRIEDKFGPVIVKKVEELGSKITRQILAPDSIEFISQSINTLIAEGANMIAVTGGMSVDPDDVTPASIRAAGGRVVSYGAPTLPGSMFMLAYIADIPVIGLPGCVMYHKSSIFDLVVPRILAGEILTRSDIVKLAYGGVCHKCESCSYPDCAFGK